MKLKNSFYIQKTEIDFEQTLSCGQIFSYQKTPTGFVVLSGNKIANVIELENCYKIYTKDIDYFLNFFDLCTDYNKIKTTLKKFKVLKEPIDFGKGIRILRQNIFETIISFVISANNNIKRITNSVFFLREKYGEKIDGFQCDALKCYYAFPTLEKLLTLTEDDFRLAGLGYRSAQVAKLVSQLNGVNFEEWGKLPTDQLKSKLVELSGIGPKVADCIMLFGYGKTDVFPVDTWIEKVFNEFFYSCKDRVKIRRILVDKFKNLSGYAQQYLFYYQRSGKK